MKQLHTIQLAILRKLLFARQLRYSELRPSDDIENNQLDFHLDQLIRLGFVGKSQEGYALTETGKDYANRMDPGERSVPLQAKLGVILCCVRDIHKEREYLIYTRTKHPFFGCQGFMSGKIRHGEQVAETATRELFEEAGLSGVPEIVAITHYRVYSPDKTRVIEDKFLFFCRVLNPTGVLTSSDEGSNEWVAASQLLSYVQKPFVSIEEFSSNVRTVNEYAGVVRFEEIDQVGDRF